MNPTCLVYSSHDRCNLIHDEWIVQRALHGNKRILFLPLSTPEANEDDASNQQSAWEAFKWFFWYYGAFGLDAFPFLAHARLEREDVELLWHAMSTAEVVILGGGNPQLGMVRFEHLGTKFHGDPKRFSRILLERKANGLLTAGFSAGADQLCQFMSSASGAGGETPGLAVATNVIATSHFEPGQEGWVSDLAKAFPRCMTFGLPNDSALAVSEGRTSTGDPWQVIRAIVDTTWARPNDAFHIKTRQGVPIFHAAADGRQQGLQGGDAIVRIQAGADTPERVYFAPLHAPVRDYRTQQPAGPASIEELFAAH